MLTVGSLFAGIGGFDLGFERAGFEIKWQVEIDPFCRKVLEKHWPQVKRYEDVRTVHGPYCEREHEHDDGIYQWCSDCLEPVDVICGGFPCKQTSVAAAITRRRVGLAGRDSGLWREMRRIIRVLQPRFCVVENPDSFALTEVSRDLAGLGFHVTPYRVEAAGFGAPHLRRRVCLVADAHGPRLARCWTDGSPPVTCEQRLAVERNPWLSSLPGVLRVDDGVPGRMDRRERIQGCGNAVIPIAAQWIAERIKEAEGLR